MIVIIIIIIIIIVIVTIIKDSTTPIFIWVTDTGQAEIVHLHSMLGVNLICLYQVGLGQLHYQGGRGVDVDHEVSECNLGCYIDRINGAKRMAVRGC